MKTEVEERLGVVRELVENAEKEIRLMKKARTRAYWERNQMLAALSKLLPAHLARHPEDDASWESDWKWIVVIFSAQQQMTWHIHDSELGMFDHLSRKIDYVWDGHTTDEKYKRLAEMKPTASWYLAQPKMNGGENG